jgi:DNA-binding NtrC family response regulator
VTVRIPADRLLEEIPFEAQDDAVIAPIGAVIPCRLVLLEDNDSVRKATELFLSLEGFEVASAASVSQAEPLLTSMQHGDVLITDYRLEGQFTGLEVLLRLREQQHYDIPAIVMSGDLQSMMRNFKSSIPRCRFLSKPVDTKALLGAIADLSTGRA